MTNHNIFRSSDWEPVPDGAIRANVSRQAIHQAIKRGTIRSMRLGKRNTLVLIADVNRYIQSREMKAS